ncbi:MAG: exodeoxyribonuclease III [Treponema sp.]|nr:exodeoxyribonuclease III [Treponema sp.]MCL2251898.1 exodeoxyribonuclease III [Treponema sp.]
MRIISWNVNGIRAVEKKGFFDWLKKEDPDILCLNETKAEPGQLSSAFLKPSCKTTQDGKISDSAVYHSFWASAKKRGYSGVAIYTKEEPLDVHLLGQSEFDDEGRVLIAEYKDFSLIAAYFPNSQDEGKRLSYKLAFNDAMLSLCNSIVKKGRHFLLCGDFNAAHTPIDLARPKQNENSAGYLPEERAWMDKFLAAGHIDTFRHFHPGEKGFYTWWSYRSTARENNIGWRIDYHCVDKNFISGVKSSIIRNEVTGSDHCPVEIEIIL